MRLRSSIFAFLVLPIAVIAQGGGWRANPDVVARLPPRPGINYDESRVAVSTLPDPLAGRNGRVATAAQWPSRREEILGLFRDNVYGRSPGPPEHVAFTVLEEDPRAMAGAATLRRVRIESRQGQRSHQFELTLFLPNTPGRAPVFLFINNRPVTNTDASRAVKSGFWPAEQIVARGYGMATFHYGQIAPDDKDTFRTGAMALFDGATGAGQAPAYTWGALAAWGWGASRAMDYFAKDARIDAARVAVVGHSRGGKAALWAAAEDPRFALVVSNESGEGGAALSRRWYGETVERINAAFPYWFAAAYKGFNTRVAELPVDQHMLLALIAPRALYVASADEDLWADPRGEFLSLVESSPIFGLFGDPAIGRDAMPALDTPLVAGRRGYHVRRGDHDLTPYDWDRFADFADRVWKK
jgi:hypothetical protein